MPDITMCSGNDCPLKDYCYRYRATPSESQQSYFASPPVEMLPDGQATCSHHAKMTVSEIASCELDKLDTAGLEEDDECPNCQCGTLERIDDSLICRGECGGIYRAE